MKAVTVAELVAFLQTQPQDLPVVYRRWSEQCLLELGDIVVEAACKARPDGWVENYRHDRPKTDYLFFPGN